jgi:1-pyrroline-5-carboxylate dehydrogenase
VLAASRVYVPQSLWPDVRDRVVAMMREMKVGDPADFRTFMGAVIDKKSFEKISGYLDDAGVTPDCSGRRRQGDRGYFIEPSLIETRDPGYRLMCEEIFGPSSRVRVSRQRVERSADDRRSTSPYALTGAFFARDRARSRGTHALRNAAGNFYINDKPTGAVVGQQPFGGARASAPTTRRGRR